MAGTALCQAIQSGHFEMVNLVLMLGANINAEDYDGGFALPLAIRKHKTDFALKIISFQSCDVNIYDPVSKQVSQYPDNYSLCCSFASVTHLKFLVYLFL